ncbi:hypothetical protein RIF29_01949 [Crotalaria pallida]|uniref:Uncharacterized protein n=1 Tax=Crotalaria pallida TaxID=3830 RepID=A0AAN9J014_CROPI
MLLLELEFEGFIEGYLDIMKEFEGFIEGYLDIMLLLELEFEGFIEGFIEFEGFIEGYFDIIVCSRFHLLPFNSFFSAQFSYSFSTPSSLLSVSSPSSYTRFHLLPLIHFILSNFFLSAQCSRKTPSPSSHIYSSSLSSSRTGSEPAEPAEPPSALSSTAGQQLHGGSSLHSTVQVSSCSTSSTTQPQAKPQPSR